ncbi:energy-coupling factor ABC transporter substrate-binding protein [Desulforamulus ruminis]|uniref:Cobalt transport protein CbiN n=1 Tax=Desulforamulus ruminis (strain ATCC 23193 / DSM 2154 / NCIMB 8452 / DL) TaxID=696281 RepID=F6DVJ6_DESRL|nr:energy-coupling factor ABC transporter substrate-binding protein [Desulforamulus ruminis]AEG61456.1 cobalt transport protein [Desulforamulus ruminis DSM 2154]
MDTTGKQSVKKTGLTNFILLAAVILLAIIPLVTIQGAEFGGADGQAEEIITQVNPDYQPWFQPLWEPPSGEIESLLFALQAALGAGFICYFLGYARGRRLHKDAIHR